MLNVSPLNGKHYGSVTALPLYGAPKQIANHYFLWRQQSSAQFSPFALHTAVSQDELNLNFE